MKEPNTRKVIVDTDMGWDDVLSLLYLMKHPAVEIVGIAVTGCGETNLRWGTIIAKTLMELGNQTQSAVAVGTEAPLKFDHVFPQSFKNDINDIMGLLGTLNPETSLDLDDRPDCQFMAGGMTGYQSHCEYLDVDLTEKETDNHCGNLSVAGSGSRKITIVQGVSETAFTADYSKVINGPLLK